MPSIPTTETTETKSLTDYEINEGVNQLLSGRKLCKMKLMLSVIIKCLIFVVRSIWKDMTMTYLT